MTCECDKMNGSPCGFCTQRSDLVRDVAQMRDTLESISARLLRIDGSTDRIATETSAVRELLAQMKHSEDAALGRAYRSAIDNRVAELEANVRRLSERVSAGKWLKNHEELDS